MTRKIDKLINQLAQNVVNLKPPIHIIAICSGGKTVGKQIAKYLDKKGIKNSYHEVWTNIINGKANIWKSDFKREDYIGTVLIAEDVIWKGTSVKAAKKMLYSMKRKKIYTAVLLDCNKKADFSVFN